MNSFPVFDAQIVLPNELWNDVAESFGTDWVDGLLEDDVAHSDMLQYDDQSDLGSTPGSIGYLSYGSGSGFPGEVSTPPMSFQDITQTMHIPSTASCHSDSKVKKAKPAKLASTEDRSVDPNKYKTRLCRNWRETGKCPYGETCVYAHGTKEMRCQEDNEAAVLSLTKLADHLSRQRVSPKVPMPKLTSEPVSKNINQCALRALSSTIATQAACNAARGSTVAQPKLPSFQTYGYKCNITGRPIARAFS